MPTTVSKAALLTLVAGLAISLYGQPSPSQPPAPAPTPAPAQPAPADKPQPPATPSPAQPETPAQPGDTPPATPPTTPPGTPSATPPDAPPAGTPAAPAAGTPSTTQPAAAPPDLGVDAQGRRISPNSTDTVLAFPKATVEQLIPFIVESTGKVVMPSQTVLQIRITVVNDKPIPRAQALDLVFFALQQAGVAVIEREHYIQLVDQTKVGLNPAIPVLGATDRVADRSDLGAVYQKVFELKHASATSVADIIKGSLPENAVTNADNDGNKVIVTTSIAALQRAERVIDELDRPPADLPKSETFHLQFANPDEVSTWITSLFADTSNTRRNTQPGQGNQQGGGRFPGGQRQGGGGPPGAQPAADAGSGARAQATPTSSILRVTSNNVQRTITVVAEGNILELIRKQVQEWDKPVPVGTIFATKIYQLKYQDPVKMRIALEGILGTGNAGGGGQQNRQTQSALSNQYTFQALQESGRLIVAGKTEDSLKVIDDAIAKLDQPMTSGLPEIIELKHVQAEDLAEQLNALLAQEGTFARIRRVNTELSTGGSASSSPFSTEFSTSSDGGFTQSSSNQDWMDFWWQRARVATDNFGVSNLVAKARIVPITKRNSIMVLAPLEYKESLHKLIDMLDKPGRQVLIAAVVAEISTEGFVSLGLRISNAPITLTNPDYAISAGPRANNANTITGTQNNFLPGLFETSVLDVGANVYATLQLLAQDTRVNILSEPKIFTGDNQEADFFDGQDIPFITNSQPNSLGNVVNSFDYRAVGINLKVRPRITPERDVDLKVNLELSSIVPGQTLFGGAVVDRRQTTTQLIVRDGQTVIVSGILKSEDSDIIRKVPLLGDIPLIGEAFKNRERTTTNTELIAFITPLVVNNIEESDKVNEGPRKRLDQLRKELRLEKTTGDAPLDLGPAPSTAPKQFLKPHPEDTHPDAGN